MSAARDVAYRCVMAVTDDDAYANLVMPGLIHEFKLDGRDAAFATELAYGALRMRGQYDAIIAKAARREPESIDAEVRSALWIGAHQVLAMRVPPHAAVSETVNLVRRERGQGAAKFANAIMRRITEKTADAWLAVIAPGTSREAKAVRFSHPEWVVAEFEKALAADGRAGEIDALLEADNAAARVTLAARPGLVAREDVVEETGGEAGRWSPWAVTMTSGRPGDLTTVTAGTAAVQDEGSQVAAGALAAVRDVEPGERWLDMCAGPGGKAALLGALASQHGVHLDALELHQHRADLVCRSVRAIPPGTVTVHVGDAREWGDVGTYDRIILDAPCSGLGALRRRPESRWRREPGDLRELVELQSALLSRAQALLAPGGVIAFITCSPVVAETRDVVAGSSLRQIDARPAVAALTGTDAQDWGAGPHVQLWPHAHGTDAMFVALLERAS